MHRFRRGLLVQPAGEIQSMVDGKPLAGLIRPEFIRAQWQAHNQGYDRSDILWGLLLIDRWMQQHGWLSLNGPLKDGYAGGTHVR